MRTGKVEVLPMPCLSRIRALRAQQNQGVRGPVLPHFCLGRPIPRPQTKSVSNASFLEVDDAHQAAQAAHKAGGAPLIPVTLFQGSSSSGISTPSSSYRGIVRIDSSADSGSPSTNSAYQSSSGTIRSPSPIESIIQQKQRKS